MSQPDQCTCVHELDKLHIVNEYADNVACDFVDVFGGICPEMMDYVVQNIVVRFVHMAVWSHDHNLEHNERKTLDAVAAYLTKLSATGPAALKIIMDEAKMKGEPNAHH